MPQPQINANKTPYILGLDVGTNSIGWAVVDCKREENGKHQGIYAGYQPISLRALNSRIFSEMLEAKTRVPKNQKRREARGARNRRTYYKKRRKNLIEALTDVGLLPQDYQNHPEPEKQLHKIDRQFAERKLGKGWSKTWHEQEKAFCSPYAIRNFSLEEKLEPYELGRLLLHLQRRRGYFSNRGAKYIELIKSLNLPSQQDNPDSMSNEERKETGKVLTAIQALEQELKNHTLGQYIWKKAQEKKMPPRRITLLHFEQSKTRRGETVTEKLQFRAKREMYEKEFDAIWKKQSIFHKIPEKQSKKIKAAIFHQRPLQLQKSTVGHCSIYPRKKRAATVRLEFQEFRTLQMINNLKINERALSKEQCHQLFSLANNPERLNKHGRISWTEVARTLGVQNRQLNYSESGDPDGSKSGLAGNKTAWAICNVIGVDRWQKLGKEKQVQLVEDLHTIHNKQTLYNRLVGYWSLPAYRKDSNPEQGALGLTMNEQWEDGYAKYSLKAINQLLPHLREGSNLYAALEKIGQQESVIKPIQETKVDYLLSVEDIPNIANPIVQKALYEIRRVVNSIVKRYGKPAIIRIELARDMKSSKIHRKEIAEQQKGNRKRNEEAEKEILEYTKMEEIGNSHLEKVQRGSISRISPEFRAKYKMWKGQDEKCPYCQELIGIGHLFSGEAEIDHIFPYTGFRKNHMNTLVSCRRCNQEKGKRTPYEAWGHDTDRWQRIEEFAREKYRGSDIRKQRKILKKQYEPENENDFVERQLNDTRYIATASKKVLEKYGVPVDVNNGAATSELRRRLGLNDILPRKPDSSVYVREGEMLLYKADKAEKKSRHDHHHHAIDAFVVAITDRAMLKAMIEVHKQEQDRKYQPHQTTKEGWIKRSRLKLPKSWENNQDLPSLLRGKLNATVVSHMVNRKVWGALHEETIYGKSHYTASINIEGMTASILKEVQAIAEAEPGSSGKGWILEEDLRSILLEWSIETRKFKLKDRALPCWRGKDLKKIVYQKSRMTVRKRLIDEPELLSGLSQNWKPEAGKRWIAEKSIHQALYQWLENNNLTGNKNKELTKRIKKALKESSPRVIDKGGELSAPIFSVRVAMKMTDSYFKVSNERYVQPGSNHHIVIFHNGKEGEKSEKRCRIVTMLEAARRRKPVVAKEPPAEWGPGWHHLLDLCVNDMVICEEMSIFEDQEKFADEHAETPYFRVQTISGEGNKKIDLSLRHHSVSGTDSEWGKWRIQSLKNLNFKKVQLGNLGKLPVA